MTGQKTSPQTGILYLCATPIGNLEDITLRTLRVLREADLIAAEDTRHTRKLLSHYDIHTPMTSYHEHNKYGKGPRLIAELKNGKTVALVSDAGTPGISDPGQEIIAAAAGDGIPVVPVPGASAVVAALTCSGLPTNGFVFTGFWPRAKKERHSLFEGLAAEEKTVVFYESPRRLVKTLEEIRELVGDRHIAVGRELTKVHEEVVRGRISTVLNHFRTASPKGEFTVVMEGRKVEKCRPASIDPKDISEIVRRNIIRGLDKKEAVKEAARTAGISKREVYGIMLEAEGKK